MKISKTHRFETLAVHAGHGVDQATGAVTEPIHLSTTFERGADGSYPHGYLYSRNHNPNRNGLEAIAVRVVVARIEIAVRVRAVGAALEGGGEMDRLGDRAGGLVDAMAGMHREGLESVRLGDLHGRAFGRRRCRPIVDRAQLIAKCAGMTHPIRILLLFSLLACSVLARAQDAAQRDEAAASAAARTRQIVARVDPVELRATIDKLVSFGTRHTLSDTVSETRGIGAARRWVAARFAAISKECGGCLTVIMPSQVFSDKRMPQPTEVMDVIAIQRGTSDPERVVVIAGHLDSRVSDVMNATADAPGANDDASGVAAAIESARVLSTHRFAATIVYAALSGEEQGLFGGKVLADYAKTAGWRVEADLNNDIVGNSFGEDGVHDNSTVRVFSEGTKANETPAQAQQRRYRGGEIDSPSRNVARFMAGIAERDLVNFKVRLVYRLDRFGRGGDQIPMLEAGYPAIRVTEAHEHYDRQHQDLRVENGRRYGDTIDGVDFGYLAQVTRLDALTLAEMAAAPAPPRGVTIEGALKHATTLSWQPAAGAVGYRVWWRDTTAPQWQHHRDVAASAGAPVRVVLDDIVIDDWVFGVSAIGVDGSQSPVVFPGDAGAF